MANYVITSGENLSYTLQSGDTLTVMSGGTSNQSVVSSGGTIILESGGSGLNDVTSSGGSVIVQSGGTDRYSTILTGGQENVAGEAYGDNVSGTLFVSSGGSALGGNISGGGVVIVSSGGTAQITVNSGGTLIASSGGTAQYSIVSSGGTLIASSGGTGYADPVTSGGTLIVSAGGTSISDQVSSGGTLIVSSGGTGLRDAVSSGGTLIASLGGRATSAQVSSGGVLTVSSGGRAISDTVSSGGSVIVQSGGSDSGTKILTGGQEIVYGQATKDTVSSGGTLTVSSGGHESGSTVGSGGTELVYGVAVSDTILSAPNISSNGGAFYIGSGGTAIGTMDESGYPLFFVDSGGTAIDPIFSGTGPYGVGVQVLGGTILGAKLYASASLGVGNGGYESGSTIFSGANDEVGAHGLVVGDTISGGTLTVEGVAGPGTAISTTVVTGELIVGGYNGGSIDAVTASDTTVSSGGTEVISSAGTSIIDTIDSGGSLVVGSGGTAIDTNVLGTAIVKSSGYESGVQVSAGGMLIVSSGGTDGYGVVTSGGSVTVQSGGTDQYGTIDAGAQESVAGLVVGDTVASSGALIVSSGGTISGGYDAGTVVVSSGGTFTGTETIAGGSALFEFGSGMTGSQTGIIQGFNGGNDGDKIQFGGYDSGATVSTGNGTVMVSENGSSLTVNIAGIYAGENLVLTSGGFLGVCFLEGTHILAEDGERQVESLRAGDMVATLRNGQQVLQPVHWVGHRSVKITGSKMADAYPVRIRAGAFAEAVPHRDLLITQEHCVFVDGKLIPARMLVNGRSIIIDRTISSYTYYHVELEQHGILLSEGLATESYLDTGNRGNFANHEAMALRPDFSVNGAHKNWQTDAAAALTVDRAAVEPVWRMLEERARAQGVASTVAPLVLSEDPHLRLATDAGLEIRPVRVTNGRYMFMVPATASELRLLSRTARPCETVGPFVDDRRDLGVLVGEVAVWHGRQRVVSQLHLTTPALDGWFTQESEAARRWTGGNAVLPVSFGAKPILAKAVLLEIEVLGAGPYLQTLEAEEDNRLADSKSA